MNPLAWICPNCSQQNDSTPRVASSDKGEVWDLVCGHCSYIEPVVAITAEGVRLRDVLAAMASDDPAREELREQYRAEVTRPTRSTPPIT